PQLTSDPLLLPLLGWLDEGFGTLHLYLASICVWAGVVALLFEPRARAGPLRWYVLFGALACLALYPRADTLHAIVSSPLSLVVGLGALWLLARTSSGWRRGAILASWLAVPIVAVAPQTVWRVATLVSSESQRLDYVELGLTRAQHQLVTRGTAE